MKILAIEKVTFLQGSVGEVVYSTRTDEGFEVDILLARATTPFNQLRYEPVDEVTVILSIPKIFLFDKSVIKLGKKREHRGVTLSLDRYVNRRLNKRLRRRSVYSENRPSDEEIKISLGMQEYIDKRKKGSY